MTRSALSDATPIELAGPPIVTQISPAVHGQVAVERWTGLRFWSLHAYTYRAELLVGTRSYRIEPGCVSVLPPMVELEYRFRGVSEHVYAHFQPSGASTAAEEQTGRLGWELPIMCRLSRGAFKRFHMDMLEAASWHASNQAPVAARIWDLLWRLARPLSVSNQPHPTVLSAVAIMQRRLGEADLRIEDIARQLNVSHAHLVRLFRSHLNTTPRRLLRLRRAQWAGHLLMHTTVPGKSIAAAVGVADIQQLNKLLRRELGRSPRQLRLGGTGTV
jgi:AraC-like DNA-binding protein